MRRVAVILVLLSACGGPVTPLDSGVVDVPTRGIFTSLDSAPVLTCTSIRFTFVLSGLEPLPAPDTLSYTIAEDWAMDGGSNEMPITNTCGDRTVNSSGEGVYSVCFENLMPRRNYFIRLLIGFDGSSAQPVFRIGTPACSVDAGPG
jgi:hypothetical protein